MGEGEEQPKLALYAVDRAYTLLGQAAVADDGSFDLPAKVLSKADLVLVGPPEAGAEELRGEGFLRLRAGRFITAAERAIIDIPKRAWVKWLTITRCVEGSVKHCFPTPWLLNDLVAQAAISDTVRSLELNVGVGLRADALASPRFHYRCEPVCDALVEVYRRLCCCRPWVIYDPRFDDLIDELERVPFDPPIEPGDPPPFRELPFFQSGAVDERTFNARRDLTALKSLPAAEKVAYVEARPYLRCFHSCGTPSKVAQGFVDPDGDFTICWQEP